MYMYIYAHTHTCILVRSHPGIITSQSLKHTCICIYVYMHMSRYWCGIIQQSLTVNIRDSDVRIGRQLI